MTNTLLPSRAKRVSITSPDPPGDLDPLGFLPERSCSALYCSGHGNEPYYISKCYMHKVHVYFLLLTMLFHNINSGSATHLLTGITRDRNHAILNCFQVSNKLYSY